MKQTQSRPNRVGSADLCVCFVKGDGLTGEV
jgi:hypothetical protein